MKVGFCFPGQGSQQVGMGRGFYDASPAVRALYQEASVVLGFDLAKLSFEGPEADLQLTANTQPAILTASVGAATLVSERGVTPALVAGHSLGEYSALVVAGALAFQDAVRLVRRRGEFMQEAVPVGVGAMAAIVGVALPALEAICEEASRAAGETREVVGVANINSATQVVIAGHRSAVERALALVSARGGGRSVLLPVSAPFHCALMDPAAERLARELEAVTVTAPKIPVVRNVDAGLTTSAEDVVPFLVKQVTSPVRWVDCVRRMIQEGATAMLELGPGRVLTGLLRRIDGNVWGHAVEDPSSLETALAALGTI
jgi:[acyl-carrier-protein] S-malonyltransferase